MAGEAYELLALFMRYVFVVIGILILWRAFRWLRRDAGAYRREMRALPDAGLIGEIVELSTGKSQPLPREGIMGASRFCDIRLKGAGVRRYHAIFALEEGKGLQVIPQRGSRVLMAGVEIRGAAHALHGTELQLGDTAVRVRLFAGLKVPHPSRFREDLPSEETDVLWETDAPWMAESEEVPPPFGAGFRPVQEMQDGAACPPAQSCNEQYFQEEGQAWQQPLSGQSMYAAPPPAPEEEAGEEGLPYESPVPRRRRRSGR